MQSKRMFGNTVELCQTALGKTPKRFNAVDMAAAFDKLIVTMIHPKVFVKTNVNQAIIATPAIGMDDTQRVSFASDHRLQGRFRGVWNNLRVNLIESFQEVNMFQIHVCFLSPLANRVKSCHIYQNL